jgi:hypothetical protein
MQGYQEPLMVFVYPGSVVEHDPTIFELDPLPVSCAMMVLGKGFLNPIW